LILPNHEVDVGAGIGLAQVLAAPDVTSSARWKLFQVQGDMKMSARIGAGAGARVDFGLGGVESRKRRIGKMRLTYSHIGIYYADRGESSDNFGRV
jgi:hypothetical protein